MNTTIAKVYGAIIGIPLGALLLAGALGGDSKPDYQDYSIDLSNIQSEDRGGFGGSGKTEAEVYGGLGHLNPCLIIECEGE